MILDQEQVLDQEIAPARPVPQKRAHILESLQVDLPALGRPPRFAAAARNAAGRGRHHCFGNVHRLLSRVVPPKPVSRRERRIIDLVIEVFYHAVWNGRSSPWYYSGLFNDR
jgi:hypothetical protein